MKYYKYFLVISLLIFIRCEDSIFNPKPTGSVAGFSFLKGQYNHEGIKVSFNHVDRHVHTDSTGKWIIKDLPQGIYTITFSKDGYGTYKFFGYAFLGGGDDYFSYDEYSSFAVLYKIPDYSITNISAEIDTIEYYDTTFYNLDISGSLSEVVDGDYEAIAFVGLSEDVSCESGLHIYYKCANMDYSHSKYSLSIDIYHQTYGLGLQPGTEIYIRSYAGCSGGYKNPKTIKKVHTALNPNSSDVIKITLP